MDDMRKDGVNDRVNQEMIVCYTRENGKTIRAEITGELVRCKDCTHAHMTYDGECKYCDIWFPDDAVYVDGDYYCASGELKEGGDG